MACTRSDSDDGDGDSDDDGEARGQEDDGFSMLTAAATESLEHVRQLCVGSVVLQHHLALAGLFFLSFFFIFVFVFVFGFCTDGSWAKVKRAINQNDTKPVDPDFEQLVASVVQSEGAQYVLLLRTRARGVGTVFDGSCPDSFFPDVQVSHDPQRASKIAWYGLGGARKGFCEAASA